MKDDPTIQKVIIKDIDMPFWSVVGLMIQWAIAAIPALIILMIFFAAVSVLFGGLLVGLGPK